MKDQAKRLGSSGQSINSKFARTVRVANKTKVSSFSKRLQRVLSTTSFSPRGTTF